MQPSTEPGRVAIVTGGTRGIGAAITRRLAGQGVHVVAVYRGDKTAAAALAAELDGLTVEQVDVADPSACTDLVRRVLDEHGRLDHLVTNAGLLVEAAAVDTDPSTWEQVVAVNLSAAFHLCRAALPAMRAAGFGRIVTISSVTA